MMLEILRELSWQLQTKYAILPITSHLIWSEQAEHYYLKVTTEIAAQLVCPQAIK